MCEDLLGVLLKINYMINYLLVFPEYLILRDVGRGLVAHLVDIVDCSPSVLALARVGEAVRGLVHALPQLPRDPEVLAFGYRSFVKGWMQHGPDFGLGLLESGVHLLGHFFFFLLLLLLFLVAFQFVDWDVILLPLVVLLHLVLHLATSDGVVEDHFERR